MPEFREYLASNLLRVRFPGVQIKDHDLLMDCRVNGDLYIRVDGDRKGYVINVKDAFHRALDKTLVGRSKVKKQFIRPYTVKPRVRSKR